MERKRGITRKASESSLSTERSHDPAKVDDAALSQIASLAAEHEARIDEDKFHKRVAKYLQEEGETSRTERLDRL